MSYEDLKPFRGDHGYSKEIMDQTFQGIYDNIFVCDFLSADTYYVKLIPWCDYVKRRIEATKAIPYNPEKYLKEEPFDRIFNDLPDYAYTTHILIMSMLFFVGIGFIGNLLCLYWFNSNSNRSGATLYLTFAVIFDLLYLSGFTILYPYQLSSPNITEQFNRYQNYTLHLIPRFKPCVESCSLISLWLVIALLIDRLPIAAETISPHTETLLDPKIRESVNRGRSRCRYSIHMIIILFFFTIYTVLKSFSYYIAKYHRYNNLKIENMLLSQNFFKIALNYVMRPIIEILLPGLLIVWYLVLIRDKKYGFKKLQSFKKKNIQIENERITDRTSGLSNYEIVTDYNTTARTNAMMNMSILDCKRWRNEFIVSKMTVNIALFYLFYLIFQTIIYFIWIDVKTDRVTNLIFTYINVVSTTVIISLKPFVYLFSNKTVIKEFHKIQKSNLYSVNPTSGWHRSRKSASQDSDRILK